MAYMDVVEMARSQSLMNRVAACAALEGEPSPSEWAMGRAWKIASSAGWADKWSSAASNPQVRSNPDGSPSDLGNRQDVISDGDVLSAVNAIRTAEQGGA